MAPPGASDHCRRLVARTDKERYWATLFAPAERRDALYALYAFDHELSRVTKVVREPMAGEVRFQWWSDVVEGSRDPEAAGHPVAAALRDAIARHNLPAEQVTSLIDAWAGQLYAVVGGDAEQQAMPITAVVVLAARILGVDDAEVEHIAQHAALAKSLARAERPDEARAHLNAARDLLSRAPKESLPALLPFGVVGPSLDRRLPAWRRQWLIWRSARDPMRIFS